MDTFLSTNISRRSLAKGAAWAAPAVVATTAVPAYAASNPSVPSQDQLIERQKSLQGIFQVVVDCPVGVPNFRLIGAEKPYPQGGFWTGGTDPSSLVDNASFTLYVADYIAQKLTWLQYPGKENGWSLPTVNDAIIPVKQGYTAYTFFYNGTNWAYDPVKKSHYITEEPSFYSWFSDKTCPARTGVPVQGYRRVNIDGQLYEYRGPEVTVVAKPQTSSN